MLGLYFILVIVFFYLGAFLYAFVVKPIYLNKIIKVGDVWINLIGSKKNPFEKQIKKFKRVLAKQGKYVEYEYWYSDSINNDTSKSSDTLRGFARYSKRQK